MRRSRGLLLIVGALAAAAIAAPAAAQDPCEDGRNLTFNCQFSSFAPAPGGEVPEGWWPFVVSGSPAFDRSGDTPLPPSLRIWSDGGAFVAGVYQEVSGITAGATYEAFIGWAVFASEGPEMGRAIGIDPRGGTDPSSPAVVWSPEVWEKKRGNPELRVRAVAEAARITVFVRVNHPRSYGADQAFLDAVSLLRDESVPLAVTEPPTATPEPTATATTPPEPTATATPEPEPTATATAEPEPTAAPEPSATVAPEPSATATAAPTATEAVAPSATVTAEPTATAVAGITAQAEATADDGGLPADSAPDQAEPAETVASAPPAAASATPVPTGTRPVPVSYDLRAGTVTSLPALANVAGPGAWPVEAGEAKQGWPCQALGALGAVALAAAVGVNRVRSGGRKRD